MGSDGNHALSGIISKVGEHAMQKWKLILQRKMWLSHETGTAIKERKRKGIRRREDNTRENGMRLLCVPFSI